MSKICIIRHGDTEWNALGRLQGREDKELSEDGIAQARQVGNFLSEDEWHILVCSPLTRAKQSALIIGKEVGIDNLVLEGDLIERDYGSASGMTLVERLSLYPDRQYPNMEEWDILRARVFRCIQSLAIKYIDMNVIIVSHSAVINSLLYTLSDGLYGSGITDLHSSCVNLLNNNNGVLEVEYYNKKVY